MLYTEKAGIRLGLDEKTGALLASLSGSKNIYSTLGADSGYFVSNAHTGDGVIEFDVSREEHKEGEVQLNEAVPDAFTVVHVVYEVECENSCAKLTMSGNARFENAFNYPPAFDVRKGDTHILPYDEGVAIAADDANPDVSQYSNFNMFGCSFTVLSMWGLTRTSRSGAYLMCAVDTNFDAGIEFKRDDDGLFRVRPYFLPEKGFWGYNRVIRFVMSDNGGITDMCMKYRSFAEKRGFVRTLREKAKALPAVDKMIGTSDVWVFNDDAMHKLYDKNAVYKAPDAEQYAARRRVADDMKKRGIDRVLWSIFDENVDADTVKYIKEKGYLTTVYDVYTDVIQRPIASLMTETRYKRCEPRLKYWPDGIVVNRDGCLQNAWQLMGKDGNYYYQSLMCDTKSIECATERIPPYQKEINVDGWFLDCVFGKAQECYSPEHPLTRMQSIEKKRCLTKLIEDMGLICGTEVGREDGVPYVVYNEGMMSISEWRPYQSGRRMAELYFGDQIDSCVTDYNLNPAYRVPLWELIYHDCMISYWYWGDSHNCCPELMDKRDLFCNLYGLPALFSFSVGNWDKLADSIEKSFKNTSPLARELGYERMVSFEYLSDDFGVQKTVFSNGVSVIANFTDRDFVLDDGCCVRSKDKIVKRNRV